MAATLLLSPELNRAAPHLRSVVGLLLGLIAAIFNGTFGIFAKDEVKGPDVDIFVFHFWACLGLTCTGILFLLFGPVAWTHLGIISGALLVLSSACAFWAANLVGVSIGPGIWCGTAAVVSFLYGLFFDPIRRDISNLPLALSGFALLLVGIMGISYAGERACRVAESEERLLSGGRRRGRVADSCGGYTCGLFLAVLAGAAGGLILAPMQYAPPEARGLRFLPSMAVGVITAAPAIDLLGLFARGKCVLLQPEKAAGPGFAAGVCWNIANAASILSIRYLGYTLAYPIMQAGMFVSGLWGIFVFDEMRDRTARRVYWLSGLVLLAGVICLALAR